MNLFTQVNEKMLEIKEKLLEIFPWAGDLVFVIGKCSRVCFLLCLGIVLVAVLDRVVRWRRKDMQGEAYTLYQSLVFVGLMIALWVPYSRIPDISWLLVHGVSIAILIHFGTLLVTRLALAPAYNKMIHGDNWVGLRLGVYSLGAGVATNAVLTAVL